MLYKLISSDKQSRQRKRPIGHVSRDAGLSNQNEEFIFFKKFNFIKCKNAIDLKFSCILQSLIHSQPCRPTTRQNPILRISSRLVRQRTVSHYKLCFFYLFLSNGKEARVVTVFTFCQNIYYRGDQTKVVQLYDCFMRGERWFFILIGD